MACQCEESYSLITAQLARIANALELSNANAEDLILTNAMLQAVVTDEGAFNDAQGYAKTAKMPVGSAIKELVDRLKAGYTV